MTPGPAQTPRKRPSIFDVAQHAGVSHQTVSRVINDSTAVRPATRERVEASIAALGYRRSSAARALARSRSQRLGLVIAHASLYGPRMVAAGVQSAARAAGFEIAMESIGQISASSLDEALSRLGDQDVEAVIVAVSHRQAHEVVSRLDLEIPLVLAEGVERDQSMAAGVDQRLGARMAVDHLVAAGHSRIAHLAGPQSWIEARQRLEGCREALGAAGLDLVHVVECDWDAEHGYDRAGELLDAGVTAVFAANDSLALGLLRACHERGVAVPDQLAVVGFDDSPDAEFFWPPLTTVRQDFSALGTAAVSLALRCLDGEGQPCLPLLVPEIVVRRSG